jgi:hypothetical protein
MRSYVKPTVQESGSLHDMTLSRARIYKSHGGSDVVFYTDGTTTPLGGGIIRHS